jgi:hypothetical protein
LALFIDRERAAIPHEALASSTTNVLTLIGFILINLREFPSCPMRNFLVASASLVVALAASPAVGAASNATSVAANEVTSTTPPRAAAAKLGIDPAELDRLIAKPLYRMSPAEVGRYISYLQATEPSLRARVAHLARKNIGQPYEIFLLGEFPYETTDPQPLFNLEKSDCLVFAEHTYAMALAHSWEDFFWVLQRMRYRDGIIGVTSRNHYTDGDWNPQNAWLVRDITRELGNTTTDTYKTTIDRSKFFRERYNLAQSIAPQTVTEPYIPHAKIDAVLPQLLTGDFVNVISIVDGDHIVSHVGLIVLGPNGERNLLHSAEPRVREESFAAFISRALEREARQAKAGKAKKTLVGFKFLRLNENPQVPPMKPQPRPARMP